MEKLELQSFPANREHNLLVVKRKVPEEPNTPSATKRVKISYNGSIEPNVEPPAAARRIPFPEKVV